MGSLKLMMLETFRVGRFIGVVDLCFFCVCKEVEFQEGRVIFLGYRVKELQNTDLS